MPVEYLSVEQEARYGRFAGEPSPGELEQFFRLDSEALGRARARRRPATRLGWAVQATGSGYSEIINPEYRFWLAREPAPGAEHDRWQAEEPAECL
jgi:hypothetical protein